MFEMSLNIIGANAVNFVSDDGNKFDYIKIIALLDNKNGYGSISQTFKYDKPSSEFDKEFGFLESCKVYPVLCKGLFESNGKTTTFTIKEIKFSNVATK